jgi:hypothetical protein
MVNNRFKLSKKKFFELPEGCYIVSGILDQRADPLYSGRVVSIEKREQRIRIDRVRNEPRSYPGLDEPVGS